MGLLENRFDEAIAMCDDALLDWTIVKEDLDPEMVANAERQAREWKERRNGENSGRRRVR